MIYKKIPLKQPGSQSRMHACTTYLISHSDMIAIGTASAGHHMSRAELQLYVGTGSGDCGASVQRHGISCGSRLLFLQSGGLPDRASGGRGYGPHDEAACGGVVYRCGPYHPDRFFGRRTSGRGFLPELVEAVFSEKLQCVSRELKPAGMILGYPVITSGPYAHHGSFRCLLGDRYDELLQQESLELQVNKDVPPAFIWHTVTDEAVPVQNSLLLVEALIRQGIPTEYHLYPKGVHGLSLANRLTADNIKADREEPCCTSWLSLSQIWLKNLCGELK
jgi:hypothetical protein